MAVKIRLARAAQRSVRSIASWWRTSGRRATAASSRRSAPTIRCSRARAPSASTLDLERIQHWLSKGAQPTDRVLRFLDKAGVAKREARTNPQKAEPGTKAKERAAAKQQKEEAAAAPAEGAAAE